MKYIQLPIIIICLACFNNQSGAQVKAGEADAKTVTLPADEMLPFNMGAAIIKKGSSTALIDAGGHFIYKYNEHFIRNLDNNNAGIFNFEKGFINSKGKILTNDPNINWNFPIAGNIYLEGRSRKMPNDVILINGDGQVFHVNAQDLPGFDQSIIKERIAVTSSGNAGQVKYGFKTLKNEIVTKMVYDDAKPFSDGMAVVGKKNEFGEMKYGFIDRTGKEVISLIYSNLPSQFHAGWAKIIPKDRADFEYAFIDHKGNMVVKVTKEMKKQPPFRADYKYFGCSLYGNGWYFMDSTGKTTAYNDFLASFGVTPQPSDKKIEVVADYAYGENLSQYDDGKIRFIRIFKDGSQPVKGFIDPKKRTVVEAVFWGNDREGLYFDPVSKLANAKVYLGRDNQNEFIFREGYINEQGVFVIVKEKGSKL